MDWKLNANQVPLTVVRNAFLNCSPIFRNRSQSESYTGRRSSKRLAICASSNFCQNSIEFFWGSISVKIAITALRPCKKYTKCTCISFGETTTSIRNRKWMHQMKQWIDAYGDGLYKQTQVEKFSSKPYTFSQTGGRVTERLVGR